MIAIVLSYCRPGMRPWLSFLCSFSILSAVFPADWIYLRPIRNGLFSNYPRPTYLYIINCLTNQSSSDYNSTRNDRIATSSTLLPPFLGPCTPLEAQLPAVSLFESSRPGLPLPGVNTSIIYSARMRNDDLIRQIWMPSS